MKKTVAFILALVMICLCAAGMAEDGSRVISINLETASDEELADAITQIKAEQKARLKTTIQLDITEIKLNKGLSQKINAVVADVPEGVTAGKLTWKSSDETVATCNNGTVKITGPGETLITCFSTLSDGTEISADVSVTGLLPVQSITLGSAKMDVMAGDVFMPDIIIKPDNASNQEVILSSSDEKTVRVDESGRLVAVMEGRATVTVTAADGSNKSTRLNVNVTKKIGKYGDELTFQGLAWGTDSKAAYNKLASIGFVEQKKNTWSYNTSMIYYWQNNDLLFANGSMWHDLPVVFSDKGIGAVSLSVDPLKTVGGYNPQQVGLYFLNGITKDGKVDSEATELCSVYIRYDNKHEPIEEIFVNLLTQLEAQYGEFTKYITNRTNSSNREIMNTIKNIMKGAKQYSYYELGRDIYLSSYAVCTLKGKNDTGIMLKLDSSSVVLFYGKTDMSDRISAIQEILEADTGIKEDAGI